MGLSRKRNKSKKEKENKEPPLKEKISEILELPKDIVLNIPKVTMIGNSNLIIENYKGIIEYDEKSIRINTAIGVVKLCGNKMSIREITSEDIMVDGTIVMIEFLG